MLDGLDQFLRTVVTTPTGWFCLSMGTGLGEWYEEFYKWPDDIDKILARAEEQATKYNVFFSSHLFDQKSSAKSHVLPTRTIQADLDEAVLTDLTITPTVLIQTSPGRHQAYWVCEEEVSKDLLEIYSQNMTYSIANCDRTGWPLGHKFRVPGTINYKRAPALNVVTIKALSGKQCSTTELELLPGQEVYKLAADHFDVEWLYQVAEKQPVLDEGPLSLLEKVKGSIPPKVYAGYQIEAQDRSAALWALTCSLFRAGLTKDEVFIVAKNSANNKFNRLKYHADRELAKDVLRAQEATSSTQVNVKQIINQARRLPGNATERRQYMAEIVLERMKQEGSFTHCDDDTLWYTRADTGRPVQLTSRSEYLRMILSVEFGLNEAETEQRYIVNDVISYAFSLPPNGAIAALSQVDMFSPAMLLHTGRKDVLRITASSVTQSTDGVNGLIFPWSPSVEPFKPNTEAKVDWAKELFESSLDTVMDLSKEQALSILKVWTLFILFRAASPSRPILALFGQPGAGKSTIFRKLYLLLYGRKRALSAVTNREDFDHAVATDCLVVLDNLDTWESWLPDRLALSAAASDRTKRKLYSDVDTVILRRQAILGITAHNPQFGREDVADRLLILNFKRRSHFEPEALMAERIAKQRNALWGSIIKDIQAVLATGIPEEYPQFRVEDFARIGAWIAQGVGCVEDFSSALSLILTAQKSFSLEEDQILVDALQRYLNKQNGVGPAWESASTLFSKLENLTPDPAGFARRYRNAIALGKKLNAFMEPLKSIMNVEQDFNVHAGTRLWRFSSKEKKNV